MLKNLTTQITAFLADRVNEIEEQLLMPDGQYQALNTKINDCLDQIGQNLPLLRVKREKCKEKNEKSRYWVAMVSRGVEKSRSPGFNILHIHPRPPSGSMTEPGTASLHGCKTAVASGSLNPIASRKAMDGEDILEALDE